MIFKKIWTPTFEPKMNTKSDLREPAVVGSTASCFWFKNGPQQRSARTRSGWLLNFSFYVFGGRVWRILVTRWSSVRASLARARRAAAAAPNGHATPRNHSAAATRARTDDARLQQPRIHTYSYMHILQYACAHARNYVSRLFF